MLCRSNEQPLQMKETRERWISETVSDFWAPLRLFSCAELCRRGAVLGLQADHRAETEQQRLQLEMLRQVCTPPHSLALLNTRYNTVQELRSSQLSLEQKNLEKAQLSDEVAALTEETKRLRERQLKLQVRISRHAVGWMLTMSTVQEDVPTESEQLREEYADAVERLKEIKNALQTQVRIRSKLGFGLCHTWLRLRRRGNNARRRNRNEMI